jgi:hypothetical protein
MHTAALEKALEKGLRFIAASQTKNGSFPGESFKPDGTTKKIQTVFDTVFILTVLAPLVDEHLYKEMTLSALQFLGSQKSPSGSYNYWQRDSPEAKQLPYPDDLDDTALALATQILQSGKNLEGETFFELVDLFTRSEIQVGGPYTTWLCDYIDNPEWRDADIGVNANIAYLLSLLDIELESLTKFFEEQIQQKKMSSKYYDSEITLIYLICRSYKGRLASELSTRILSLKNKMGHWNSPLYTGFAISTLIRLGIQDNSLEESVEVLLKQQNLDGSWNREPVYLDPSDDQSVWHHGSAPLTTAVCVEALTLFKNKYSRNPNVLTQKYTKENDAINLNFIQKLRNQNSIFVLPAEQILLKLAKSSRSQDCVSLPFFSRDMLGERTSAVPDTMIHTLGEASLLGLAGYTILDDALDGDTDNSLLPFGIWCIREMVTIYYSLLETRETQIIHKILSETEQALHAEFKNRLYKTTSGFAFDSLPDTGDIPTYEKSIGHALSTLVLLLIIGESPDSELCTKITLFWKHYLAAYQLHDDAHDFVEDLDAGRITVIGSLILKRYQEEISEKNISTKNTVPEATKLQSLFWQKVFPEINLIIEKHIEECTKIVAGLNLHSTLYLEEIVQKLARAQQKAKNERKSVIDFMEKYKKQTA